MTETNEAPEIEETDQQRLEAKIAAIDKRLAKKKNLWLLKSRNDLQDYLETNFDADGTEIPPTPVESQLRHDFSKPVLRSVGVGEAVVVAPGGSFQYSPSKIP